MDRRKEVMPFSTKTFSIALDIFPLVGYDTYSGDPKGGRDLCRKDQELGENSSRVSVRKKNRRLSTKWASRARRCNDGFMGRPNSHTPGKSVNC
jgi:hypothetical protein